MYASDLIEFLKTVPANARIAFAESYTSVALINEYRYNEGTNTVELDSSTLLGQWISVDRDNHKNKLYYTGVTPSKAKVRKY